MRAVRIEGNRAPPPFRAPTRNPASSGARNGALLPPRKDRHVTSLLKTWHRNLSLVAVPNAQDRLGQPGARRRRLLGQRRGSPAVGGLVRRKQARLWRVRR